LTIIRPEPDFGKLVLSVLQPLDEEMSFSVHLGDVEKTPEPRPL
jgi:hypothetical protein